MVTKNSEKKEEKLEKSLKAKKKLLPQNEGKSDEHVFSPIHQYNSSLAR